MLYTVGEMAKKLGVAASTLRYYDQEGLLPFVERSSGGVRMFSDKDFGWLKVIECLKRSGLSIKEIKAFIDMAQKGDKSLAERKEMFRARLAAVKKQLEKLRETQAVLEYKCWYYEQAAADGTEARVRGLTAEVVPAQFREIKRKLDALHEEMNA